MAVGIAILGEHIKIKSLIGCILIVISTMILIIYTPKESSKPNAARKIGGFMSAQTGIG